MPQNTPDESELIRNWQNGDERSFDALFNLHFARLHRFALRHTNDPELAEELVMDIMLKVWQQKHILHKNTTSLAAFLFHILKAALVDHYRKKKLEWASLETICHDPKGPEQADSRLQATQLNELYHQALEQLSPRQRQIFKMRKDREMTYREIAAELELSAKTVDRHLSDAVLSLKKHFKKRLLTGLAILTFTWWP